MKLHGDFFKFWNVKKFDSLVELKLVSSFRLDHSPEDEELIWLLLVHDEVLPCNHSQECVELANLHAYDFIIFPCLCVKNLHLHSVLLDFLIIRRIIHVDEFFVSNHETIHRLK